MEISRMYRDQKESFTSIDSNLFDHAEESRRLKLVAADPASLVKIDGLEVQKVSVLLNNLDWYDLKNNHYSRPICYLNLTFK